MDRSKEQYKLLGRITVNGIPITYVLIDSNGAELRVSKEQMLFILGRGQVVNVIGTLSNSGVSMKCLDGKIRDLPYTEKISKSQQYSRKVKNKKERETANRLFNIMQDRYVQKYKLALNMRYMEFGIAKDIIEVTLLGSKKKFYITIDGQCILLYTDEYCTNNILKIRANSKDSVDKLCMTMIKQ